MELAVMNYFQYCYFKHRGPHRPQKQSPHPQKGHPHPQKECPHPQKGPHCPRPHFDPQIDLHQKNEKNI